MAQSVKALAAKPGDLSLIPQTNEVEQENWLQKVAFWHPHTGHNTRACLYTHAK